MRKGLAQTSCWGKGLQGSEVGEEVCADLKWGRRFARPLVLSPSAPRMPRAQLAPNSDACRRIWAHGAVMQAVGVAHAL
eukprot:2475881-Pleurochrysis_carterae.AAC.1